MIHPTGDKMATKTMMYAIVAVAILAVASVGAYVVFFSDEPSKPNGFIVDYGSFDTEWNGITYQEGDNPLSILQAAYDDEVVVVDGIVTKIGDTENEENGRTWAFWRFQKDAWKMHTGAPEEGHMRGATAIAWAYTTDGEIPAKPVDSTGKLIYGWTYGPEKSSSPSRIISLMPSGTEIINAVGGVEKIIGVDKYSNFPNSVLERSAEDYGGDDKIAIVADYYNSPSTESLIRYNPDLVIGEEVNTDLVLKLRQLGVNAIALDSGIDIDSIFTNIHIVGVVLGNDDQKNEVISEIQGGIDKVIERVKSLDAESKTVLSCPSVFGYYLSGPSTFIGSMLNLLGVKNVLSEGSWVEANVESIITSGVEIMIFATMEYDYDMPIEDRHAELLKNLPEVWIDLNVPLYLLCESATDTLLRPGPRIAQALELLAIIIFDDYNDAEIDNFTIGPEYESLLDFTQDLGFND